MDAALEDGIGIDGSNIFGANVSSSDLVLIPDLTSFRRLPIYDSPHGNVAAFMCWVRNPDGTPAENCTRSVLRRELDNMVKLGFSKMNVGFEPEFFILKNPPSAGVYDKSICLDDGRAYASGAHDATDHIRREIMFELERAGIIPLTSHHENAPSAYEITYKYSDAIRSCDNLILGMMITKEVARRHDMYATFEPKPFDGVAGNGLHTNISLEKAGKGVAGPSVNAFAGAGADRLSPTARHFMAGVLNHARGIVHLTNPTPESYRRLVKGYQAPINICWGYSNRSTMIRVPNASGNGTRIEVRHPDSTMNPYLGVAGILRAGLDGIVNKTPLPEPADYNVWESNDIPTLLDTEAK